MQVFGAMMRPLTYDEKAGHGEKPLLQRMADEKRMQMERGSIGGSYFMVQLPDGTMEKRVKIPINIDPGVHSSFNLDQLVCILPIYCGHAMLVALTRDTTKILHRKIRDYISLGPWDNHLTRSLSFEIW